MMELATVMDAVPVSVLASDADGYYVYASEAAGRFLGYEPAEIVGKHITDLIAYDPRLIMANFERLKQKGHLSGRTRYRHTDGSLLQADVNIFGHILGEDTRVFVSLIHPLPQGGAALPQPETNVDIGLTDAERRLLLLLAEGFSDVQVARVLGDPEDVIGEQVRLLLEKMNVSSRTQAAVLAIKKRVVL
jgi:PAS domain S-box-containing protein